MTVVWISLVKQNILLKYIKIQSSLSICRGLVPEPLEVPKSGDAQVPQSKWRRTATIHTRRFCILIHIRRFNQPEMEISISGWLNPQTRNLQIRKVYCVLLKLISCLLLLLENAPTGKV